MSDERMVELETRVDAPPETVFTFLVDPELYVRWQGTEAELDARPGGRFRIVVEGNVVAGEYIEVSPPHRVVVTWGFEGNPDLPPGSSTVEFTLEPDGDGTVVRVRHVSLPDEAVDQHRQGWVRYLAQLTSVAGTAP